MKSAQYSAATSPLELPIYEICWFWIVATRTSAACILNLSELKTESIALMIFMAGAFLGLLRNSQRKATPAAIVEIADISGAGQEVAHA